MSTLNQSAKANSNKVPLAALTILFFTWGFITCMNDILIPHLKELFRLSYLEAMLVQFCFFGAYFTGSVIYFIISSIKGDPINKIGYKNGILLGLLVACIGCVLFYPASAFESYGLFLGAFFILGLGFTLLQIAANPYVSLLGSEESASSRLNLVQGFNSFGTTIAPILGGYLIFQFFAHDGNLSAEATQLPYLMFGAVFLLLILFIYKVKLPVFKSEGAQSSSLGAWRFPQLRGGVFAIFFYVGAEVAIGSFLISFLDSTVGLSEAVAKNYLSLYWGGAMIGRFAGAVSLSNTISSEKKGLLMIVIAAAIFLLIFSIIDLDFVSVRNFIFFIVLNLIGFLVAKSAAGRTLTIFAGINIVLLLVTIFTKGETALWALVSMGLFNSIMWSNIFTLSISGLGNYTSQGSSLLVMAILGGAIIPPIQGAIADRIGIQMSFIVPAICYFYIAWFGSYCSCKQLEVGEARVASAH